MIANIENKIKSTGWVSPMWSLAEELSPITENITTSMLSPLLSQYISRMPDEAIPQMAHDIVDGAIKNGSLSLFEGKIEFEKDDLVELKTLLKYNLPIGECKQGYEVKMEQPQESK
jgi:hypothetical protein